MNNQTNNISLVSDQTLFISETQRVIIMLLLIAFAVPSLICFLMIFYYFIELRKRLIFNCLNHHTILCILISNFLLIIIKLPFSLYYLIYGYMKSPKFCTFWIYWDYTLDTTTLFLTMYASIEYYLLIFHQQYFIKHKFFYHYTLLLFSCLFNLCLYIYFVVFFLCIKNYQYNLSDFICGGPCFIYNIFLKLIVTIFDIILPCFILLIFNLIILFRFINLTRKASTLSLFIKTMKKTRQMILQLLFISLMSLIIYLPWTVAIIVRQTFYNASFSEISIVIIQHCLPYFISFASPFLTLIGLPEIRQKLKIILCITKMI